jgi:uncharacterized protein
MQDFKMKMKRLPEGFGPYSDRVARDIRNRLSTAFIQALTAGMPEPFETEAEKWLQRDPPAPCKTFIRDRLPRYGAVLGEIQRRDIADPLHRAVVIWNHGLFFEVHEQVEAFWHESTGGLHRALQGLILAAGVYVHLEAGNASAARGLAEKSVKWLGAHKNELPEILNLNELVDAMKIPDGKPPRLQWQV